MPRDLPDFFTELERRYPSLTKEIGAELLDQLRNWRPGFAEGDVRNWFELESLSLPDLDTGEREWEFVYELKDDGHLFCVTMRDWELTRLRIDG